MQIGEFPNQGQPHAGSLFIGRSPAGNSPVQQYLLCLFLCHPDPLIRYLEMGHSIDQAESDGDLSAGIGEFDRIGDQVPVDSLHHDPVGITGKGTLYLGDQFKILILRIFAVK